MPKTKPPIVLTEVRAVSGDDMASLLSTRMQAATVLTPDRLRESHHRVARLAATGAKGKDIASRCGYSPTRVSILLHTPAMIDLVAKYRARIDDNFIEEAIEVQTLALDTYRVAQRQLLDRLDAADEEGADPIPLRDLVKIAQDGEDRFGATKKSTNINLNADFAAELEKALNRSAQAAGKVIEIETTPEGIRRRV